MGEMKRLEPSESNCGDIVRGPGKTTSCGASSLAVFGAFSIGFVSTELPQTVVE